MITLDKILEFEPQARPELARAIVAPLNDAMAAADINTPLRVAHFMAQVAWESAHFSRLEEDLNYRAETIARAVPRLADRAQELAHNPEKFANARYGPRADLWNHGEASGDGWRFRGRGLIQLTGRRNYTRFSKAGMDLIANPELAAVPENAAVLAVDFWKAAQCNQFADADNVEGVTRHINGSAMDGLDARRALTARAKVVFV